MTVSSLLALLLTFGVSQAGDTLPVKDTDWPWWRGPRRDGTAHPDQNPPTAWSDKENVLWKTPVPGRGHGSPTLAGDRLYLPTCDEAKDVQSVLCYDRATGTPLWETAVHRGGSMRKNAKSSGASGTVACDGQRLFIAFPNSKSVVATALGLDGKVLWQTKVSDYEIHQGYGSSPIPYRSLVLVTSDHKGGGVVAGVDRKTGAVAWKRDRPKNPNYTSPIVLTIGGRDQLILIGCDLITGMDPMTGKVLWETAGGTTECVTSTVTDGTCIFSSGGYPRNHLAAVRADGSARIAWETQDRVYVPSLLIRDGRLYGVLDAGTAACWASDTGKELWKARLGGTFSASPVLVGERIYATNEAGETFVFKANPEKYEPIAKNKLGEEVFATPTICAGRIYMRVTERVDGKRQEMLYCLGEKP